MAAVLAVAPLAMISMTMVTGCGGGKICLPNLCGCNGLFGAGLLAIWLLRDGQVGADGISCWDLNGNSVCDLATEDANADGSCTILDCQGPPGENGQPIPALDGIQCWDLNASGVCDPATEDDTGDGVSLSRARGGLRVQPASDRARPCTADAMHAEKLSNMKCIEPDPGEPANRERSSLLSAFL